MSRLLPKSLFGQTLLILLAGLIVSHFVGAWIYATDRTQAVQSVGGFALAQRVANLTRLIEETPPASRDRVVEALNDPTFRVAIANRPPEFAETQDRGPIAEAVAAFVMQQLPEGTARHVRVAVSGPLGPPFAMMHGHGMPTGPTMHAPGLWRKLHVAVQLADGPWVSFDTAVPDTGPGVSWEFIAAMIVMAAIILVVSVWAVRRVTAPLGEIAAAAERLGKDMTAPPLAEAGTVEMRQAARAFNEMQERLRRLVENRTRMLAAVSHDLRTPLTLLRLRAEAVPDTGERDKMLATIGEMNAMVEAILSFARQDTAAEPRRRTDLAALVASIVDDMADAGLPATLMASEPVVYECQPAALKRALTNLVDNAIKYGKAAWVALYATGKAVEITVDDDGPGIPDEALTRVFQPFYRIEESRSRETGGVGLGLAIALSIIQAHGGDLTLSNRPEGGLRAKVILPR
jgi:signal transduction histidine kinase